MEFLFANGIIALVFVLGGLITLVFPPKEINSLYGYRTSSSMKSLEAWIASNRYASKIMILAGIDLLLLGLILFWAGINNEKIWGIVTLISVISISVIIYLLTENYLKENFDEEGNPRQ